MTIEKLKKILKSSRDNEKKLVQIKNRHDELREKLISPQAQVITDMPRGGGCNKNKILDGLSAIEELDTKMNQLQVKIIKDIMEVENLLSKLTAEERKLIRMKYMEDRTWVDIALSVCVSERTAQRMHGNCLQKMLS